MALSPLQIDDFAIYTLEKIKTDLGEYGEIEQVNTLEEKSCAFVNFVSPTLRLSSCPLIRKPLNRPRSPVQLRLLRLSSSIPSIVNSKCKSLPQVLS